MALALLDFKEFNQQQAVFNIDIGTNAFYRFKIGSEKERRAGVDTISHVTGSTPLKRNRNGGTDLLDSSEEVRLPQHLFNRTSRYIQLVSCKDESGRSPAISKVISVPVEVQGIGTGLLDLNASIYVMPEQRFNPNRRLAHSHPFLTRSMSLDDVLSSLISNVLPAAVSLLGGGAAAGGGSHAGPATMPPATVNAVSSLLNLLLQAVSGRPAAVSAQQSYTGPGYGLNRFTDPGNNQFSKPFIFGIDDALLAGLAGPLIQQGIQLLPQLINSANQHKLETLRANNQLMSTLNADVQRRLMLQQLLQNFPASAASGGSSMDGAQLMQLLQQLQSATAGAPAAAAPAPAPAAAPATASSLSFSGRSVSYSMSSSVLLSFESESRQQWNGTDKIIYQKGKAIRFSIKVTANPAPKQPLPKAIFRLVLKDAATQEVMFEKTFKQKKYRSRHPPFFYG